MIGYSVRRLQLQWLWGRASDSWLRGPGFESCAAVLKPWTSFFILHCSSSFSFINEYLAIDSDTAACIADISPPACLCRPPSTTSSRTVVWWFSHFQTIQSKPAYQPWLSQLWVSVLTSQIRASLDILFVFIPLQVTQLISSLNSRISWQTWQPCTTPCAQSYYCQDLRNNLSSPLIKQPAYLNSMLVQQEIPDSYDQSVVTLFTFLGWKRNLEPELSLLWHQLCGFRLN